MIEVGVQNRGESLQHVKAGKGISALPAGDGLPGNAEFFSQLCLGQILLYPLQANVLRDISHNAPSFLTFLIS